MNDDVVSRRAVLAGLAAIPAGVMAGAAAGSSSTPGLSRNSESIHQELYFAATPARVYRALLDASQFAEVIRLGAAARLLDAPGAAPVAIDARVGGAFTLFGGYITGLQLELVADRRIVQAWHEHVWEPGEFSVARFSLSGQGAGTKVVFDHRGFPDGAGPHLSRGWYANYWDPLKAYLARGS
ncbi:MAG TPA: SRPBCC domain-containing protein [Usitatibacter sp.]|nr:SRPBCC domain-containing protein [Usitatibacter sp.]